MSNAAIQQMVTDRVIKLLEAGTIPWRKPWISRGKANNLPMNWQTGRTYRGINLFLLEPGGEYATFKQISAAGGKVKKGTKANVVVLWKPIEKKDKETGEIETIFILKYFQVFEINTQAEGLASRRQVATTTEGFQHDPVEEAENILAGYANGPTVTRNRGRAFYQPSTDHMNYPPLEDYPNPHEYYSTAFHEAIHSTGHAKRLARPGIVEFDKFGSQNYAREELIAETGAAMLCAIAGIENSTIENSAAYIASWLERLKNDKSLVITAASHAQKAVDLILGDIEEKAEDAEGENAA